MSKKYVIQHKNRRKRACRTTENPYLCTTLFVIKKMKIGHDEAEQNNNKDGDATEITQNNKRKHYIG